MINKMSMCIKFDECEINGFTIFPLFGAVNYFGMLIATFVND